MIRKAEEKDIDAIAAIYAHVHAAEQAGKLSIGWQSGVYPLRETACAALARDDLFLLEEEGEIIATAIINQTQVDVYYECPWEFEAKDEEVMVLHTLAVDPAFAGRGKGTEFAKFYEEYAKENNCTVLRMDTNEINLAARSLYKKLGYREAGIMPCVFNGISGVNLVCLEKKI